MKLYPWFKNKFQKIINKYNNKQMYHAILFQSESGMGIKNLIKNIIKYIILSVDNKIKKKNSDILYIYKKKKINIELINKIKEKIYKTNYQFKYKIIWLPNAKNITEKATNALLKIIEEPPKNTFFFMTNYNTNKLLKTLKSRFIIYKINQPSNKKSLKWLKKQTQKKNIKHILKINYDFPILAYDFIKKKIRTIRKYFFKKFKKCIKKNNFTILLIYFYEKKYKYEIDWIYTIFFDSMQKKIKIKKNIINTDQLDLIKMINKKMNFDTLNHNIKVLIKFKKYITKIPNINKKFTLIKQILKFKISNLIN